MNALTVLSWGKLLLGIPAGLAVLYLLMIMPRLGNRKERKKFTGVYYAHRGLHDNESSAPENSMAAFRKAVEAGYGIELDVQVTKDRMPVVFHDFTLERICGAEGKVSDYTYEELQRFRLCDSTERIPLFEEVLALVDGKVPLIVELKVELTDLTVCEKADELLRSYHGLYCMESFNPLAVFWYRRHHKEIVRGQLSENFLKTGEFHGALYWVLQNLLLNFLTKPDFVAYNHQHQRMLSRKLCHGLYRNMAAAWTIKSMQELDEAGKHFDIFIFDSFIPDKSKEK